jgi:hypothetical protein
MYRRRFFFAQIGAAMELRKASNRTVQRALLDDPFGCGIPLLGIQRWAALLPELVGDFDYLFGSIALDHEAQSQTAGWRADRARRFSWR